MPTVLCFGDSNTWGSATVPRPDERYLPHERWPEIMGVSLGPTWSVITEGLPGRTTVHDDPIEGAFMNGSSYLMPCLRSHRPLDIVILALGTNDLKARFAVTPFDIGDSIELLLKIIARSEAGPAASAPKCLVVCPPPILDAAPQFPEFYEIFAGGFEKSQRLAPHYARVAAANAAGFLDAGKLIVSSQFDGIHFDPDQQAILGRAIATAVKSL